MFFNDKMMFNNVIGLSFVLGEFLLQSLSFLFAFFKCVANTEKAANISCDFQRMNFGASKQQSLGPSRGPIRFLILGALSCVVLETLSLFAAWEETFALLIRTSNNRQRSFQEHEKSQKTGLTWPRSKTQNRLVLSGYLDILQPLNVICGGRVRGRWACILLMFMRLSELLYSQTTCFFVLLLPK